MAKGHSFFFFNDRETTVCFHCICCCFRTSDLHNHFSCFFSFFAVFSLSCFSLSFAVNVASTSPLFLAVDMQIIVLLLYLNILHNCKKNVAEIQKIVVLEPVRSSVGDLFPPPS